jgi:phosphoglycolate phosphatase
VTAAVVFDLDGTLADTAADIAASLHAALATLGLPGVATRAVRLMIGHGPAILAERALRHHDVRPEEHLVGRLTDAFMDHYATSGNHLTSLFPGVADCLEGLAAMNVAIGICSNKPHGSCRTLLDDLGIETRVDALQGSAPGLPKKPDPTMLREVLRGLGVPATEALYVGDSATDVQTARNAGLPVVLVSYGYTDVPAEQLGANRVVSSLQELTQAWPGLVTPKAAANPPLRRSATP